MKAFIIFHGNGGDYEDYSENIETAFFDEQKAKSYVAEKNKALAEEVAPSIVKNKECQECQRIRRLGFPEEKPCYRAVAFYCQNYCYAIDYKSLEYRYEEIDIE